MKIHIQGQMIVPSHTRPHNFQTRVHVCCAHMSAQSKQTFPLLFHVYCLSTCSILTGLHLHPEFHAASKKSFYYSVKKNICRSQKNCVS